MFLTQLNKQKVKKRRKQNLKSSPSNLPKHHFLTTNPKTLPQPTQKLKNNYPPTFQAF